MSVGEVAVVTQYIESEIRARQAGDRLPTEREWSERTGESRNTVRQALASIEARGLILRHVGKGTFVTPAATEEDDHVAASGSSPTEIMAVRLLVEPASMLLVARAGRGDDLAEIERCLTGGERHSDYEEFEKWDAAFHHSLALATHNNLLVRIGDMLGSARSQTLWGKMKRHSYTEERRLEYCHDHREITESLLERDGHKAEKAMRVHLQRVQRYLIDGTASL